MKFCIDKTSDKHLQRTVQPAHHAVSLAVMTVYELRPDFTDFDAAAVLDWYDQHAPQIAVAYAVLSWPPPSCFSSEMMLQQIATTVIPYFTELSAYGRTFTPLLPQMKMTLKVWAGLAIMREPAICGSAAREISTVFQGRFRKQQMSH